MNKNRAIFRKIFVFVITGLLIWGGVQSRQNTERLIKEENEKVAGYNQTTIDRLKNSVVTLPEEDTIVGLQNGFGDFMLESTLKKGRVEILTEYFITYFIPKTDKKNKARLDALVPLYVEGDSHGKSLYIVLFEDRGDAALEKSHARLGGGSVVVDTMEILPKDEKNPLEEYRVKVIYSKEGLDATTGSLKILPKEVIIPIVDGRFDEEGTEEYEYPKID